MNKKIEDYITSYTNLMAFLDEDKEPDLEHDLLLLGDLESSFEGYVRVKEKIYENFGKHIRERRERYEG